MARVKKTESAPRLPKHWSEVKHGCCSCRYYNDDFKDKRSPCYPCTTWSHWEDADPRNPTPPQTVSHSASYNSPAVSDAPELLIQDTNTGKPAARKTRKTEILAAESAPESSPSEVPSKKRPGRPKKTEAAPEDHVSNHELPELQPKKRARSPKKKSDAPLDAPFSADRDQLTFGL